MFFSQVNKQTNKHGLHNTSAAAATSSLFSVTKSSNHLLNIHFINSFILLNEDFHVLIITCTKKEKCFPSMHQSQEHKHSLCEERKSCL